MRVLSESECLSLWESGRGLHPLDQGLLAIRAAFPETEGANAADWPLGMRNRALAELHCACFGDTFAGWMSCPECGEKLEFRMDGRAVAEQRLPQHAATIEAAGRSFRVPTTRDLARLANQSSTSDAAARLLSLCCVDVQDEPEPDWTEEEMEEAGEKMAAADPLAEIALHFACPVCKATCEETLDLAAFVWAEVEALAKRLALDVHMLASAYGWSEREILSLSTARRRLYLEMMRA